ncbi:hypothetical protein FBU59_001077 [Linderina macrospora]|uniref:Uncharacterized protein n=1 Tax=Linderina macrospora TaxID=4868 RepID=A0ACC1JF99_9FUNG|nr:hypothetical protein FBU59_001077 [Linderina macrospora]
MVAMESRNNQSIALVMMLRGWRQIAEAKRQRHSNLMEMWVLAVQVQRDNLLHRVVVGAKQAARKVTERPGYRFERVYVDLADKFRRKCLLKRTVQRLTYASEVLNRFVYWQNEHDKQLVGVCWSALRQEMDRRQQISDQEAERKDRQSQLLTKWHKTMREEVGKRELARQKTQKTGMVFHGWHKTLKAVSDYEQMADEFYAIQCKRRAFCKLQSVWRQQKENEGAADRFYAQICVDGTIHSWNQRVGNRRTSVLQQRAIDEAVRTRNSRRRRLFLSAWRDTAGKIRRSEGLADTVAKGHNRQLLADCFGRWHQCLESSPNKRAMGRGDHRGAADAVTQTSMFERPGAATTVRDAAVEANEHGTGQSSVLGGLHLAEDNQDIEPLGYEDIEAEVGLEPISEEAEVMAQVFSAWHKLAKDRRDFEDRVFSELPKFLQRNAAYESGNDMVFDWSAVHRQSLVRRCLREMCRIAVDRRIQKATPEMASGMLEDMSNTHISIVEINEDFDSDGEDHDGPDGDDLDGPNGDSLRQIEAQISAKCRQIAVADSMRKWKVATRGSLLVKQQLVKSLKPVFANIARCARVVKAAHENEHEARLNPVIQRWQSRQSTHSLAMESSPALSDAALVQASYRKLVDVYRRRHSQKLVVQNRSEEHKKDMYMQALAFRWESEMRMAMSRWMRASSDDRIKVIVAQRDEVRWEERAEKIAETWSRKRTARSAFRQLRIMARKRRLQHNLKLRFADAWCNANLQRQVLMALRAKTSPNNSMFFSIAESIPGY